MAITVNKDPLLLELEQIAAGRLVQPLTLVYADENEANLGIDELEPDKFPVLVYVADDETSSYKIEENHNLVRKVRMKFLLLDIESEATNDFKAVDVNKRINKMRSLAENLIYWINKSQLSVAGGVDDYQTRKVYRKFDAHCMGVLLTFDWTADTGNTGYFNTPQTQEP